MKSWIKVLLVGLATYRITHLLIYDDGPKNIILQWRVKLNPSSQIGQWIKCPYCVSVWVAGAVTALYFLPSWVSDPLLLWWGAAGLVEGLEERRNVLRQNHLT